MPPLSRLPSFALLLAALLPAAWLAGCAAQPAEPPAPAPSAVEPPPPPPPAEGAGGTAGPAPSPSSEPVQEELRTPPLRPLLAYADQVLALTPAELTAEIARLTARQEESAQRQLELAIALGQTRQPVDTARALGLVQRVLGQKSAAPALQSIARLLETRFLHQRRLEDQLDRQAQQLKEAQRRNDQLNERLEAMRAIERSLNARPAGPGNGKAP